MAAGLLAESSRRDRASAHTAMTNQWTRVVEVLEAAEAREPAEREAIIREGCGDDLDVRSQVESMLAEVDSRSTPVASTIRRASNSLSRAGGSGVMRERRTQACARYRRIPKPMRWQRRGLI